jgi:exopolysaccharide production protein ExoZ
MTVQALRAVAAAAVVFHHTLSMLTHNAGYDFPAFTNGSAGVDLFFVISGFVMIYAHANDFGQRGAFASFTRRRLIRVAPLYWIATTITVVMLLIAPRMFATISFDYRNVICSYFFILSSNSLGDVGTVTQTGWTLCFEAYFYLIFGILLMLPRRYFLVAACFIFGTGLMIGLLDLPIAPWASVATRPLTLEFIFGAIIALLFMRGFSLHSWIAVGCMVLGAAVIILRVPGSDWARIATWGLSSGLILAGALSLERLDPRIPRLMLALGASSYSLYLAHPFVMAAFGKAWAILRLSSIPPIVPGVIAFCLALAVGHGVFLVVEKPLTEWLKRSHGRSAGVRAASS